jgi:hypothetical protein
MNTSLETPFPSKKQTSPPQSSDWSLISRNEQEVDLPVSSALSSLDNKLMLDIVLHSPKSSDSTIKPTPEHAKYIQLGLYSVDWIDCLRPIVSEFPPYADESGLGQTFIIVSYCRLL